MKQTTYLATLPKRSGEPLNSTGGIMGLWPTQADENQL
jgi:hypothetical protein